MLSCDSYLSPGTLGDALAAVAASDGRFRFVAGATDLLPWARESKQVYEEVGVFIARIITALEQPARAKRAQRGGRAASAG